MRTHVPVHKLYQPFILYLDTTNQIYEYGYERSEALSCINANPCLARLPRSVTQSKKVLSPPQLPTTQDDFFHALHLLPMSLHRYFNIHTKSRGLPAHRNRRQLRRRPNLRPPFCTLKLQLVPPRTPLILRRLPPHTVSPMCVR